MEDYKKGLGLFILVVFITILILTMSLDKSKSQEEVVNNNVEDELYVDQIYFKNIQLLDELPIDQSLLIQDKIMYYFVDKKEDVKEVELVEGSLNKLGDYDYTFKANYEGGVIEVHANKDKIDIN